MSKVTQSLKRPMSPTDRFWRWWHSKNKDRESRCDKAGKTFAGPTWSEFLAWMQIAYVTGFEAGAKSEWRSK